jgi:hypothetical protein
MLNNVEVRTYELSQLGWEIVITSLIINVCVQVPASQLIVACQTYQHLWIYSYALYSDLISFSSLSSIIGGFIRISEGITP